MMNLEVSRHAADRVAYLQSEAEIRRVAARPAGAVTKSLAVVLRRWANRLERGHDGVVFGTPATADLVNHGQLGHRA